MKRLKRWFVAFLVWEFFTLFKKDPKFKQGVIEKDGVDKIKHIFDWLLDFNKKLVEDAKEHFDTQALEEHLNQWVLWVEHEYASLSEEVNSLKEQWAIVTQEVVLVLQERFAIFTRTALLIKDQIANFDIEKKIQELKKILESLAKQAKKQ